MIGSFARVACLSAVVLTLFHVAVRAEDLIGANKTAPPKVTEENAPAILRGTLQTIRNKGAVTIGYREASFPFSYRRPGGAPIGYSIDLCLGIVDEIKRELVGAP